MKNTKEERTKKKKKKEERRKKKEERRKKKEERRKIRVDFIILGYIYYILGNPPKKRSRCQKISITDYCLSYRINI